MVTNLFKISLLFVLFKTITRQVTSLFKTSLPFVLCKKMLKSLHNQLQNLFQIGLPFVWGEKPVALYPAGELCNRGFQTWGRVANRQTEHYSYQLNFLDITLGGETVVVC